MAGVAEEFLGQEHAWDRGIGVSAADEIDIAAEDAVLHRMDAEHVVGDQQELLAGQPLVVLADDAG